MPGERLPSIMYRMLGWLHQRAAGRHAHGALVAPFNIHNVDEMLADLGMNVGPFTRAGQWALPINPRSYRKVLWKEPSR